MPLVKRTKSVDLVYNVLNVTLAAKSMLIILLPVHQINLRKKTLPKNLPKTLPKNTLYRIEIEKYKRSLINNSVFHYYIGFSKSQFQDILQSCPSISQRYKNKAGRALATVITKLHTEIMKNPSDPFHWFFHENDVLILDRGFRDCIEDVETCGYSAYMPLSKDDNEYELTTQQANDSRKVTMCSWVVETINGRLKNQFRQLRSQYFNVAASHLFDEIRIAAALLNAFGVPLKDHRLTEQIINRIPHHSPWNQLGDYVIANHLNRRRADFEHMNAEVPGLDDFPILSADDLVIYVLGTYQVQQARSYYGENIKSDGSYVIEVCREPNRWEPSIGLIRGFYEAESTPGIHPDGYIIKSYTRARCNFGPLLLMHCWKKDLRLLLARHVHYMVHGMGQKIISLRRHNF
ncbi:hypothetical protein HW555_006474 [Spodoptera exigua]|uniref:DDE Tnp4 domain-containing protein n=1 Tax=Spodoptera exigua TaxID=7107 RepID=A0A835L3I2_SPOEX|nr:hypothetical protein HW555_006474 [Spodoptera exigua]